MFTNDLCQAICQELQDDRSCHMVAMDDVAEGYGYPDRVRFEVRQEQRSDYRLAADFLNIRAMDLLLVQHEYGIFGGKDSSHLLTMLRDVRMPVVTTMHTILREPSESVRQVTRELTELSDRLVVMSSRGMKLLEDVYGVPPGKVVKIPHGIPDMPFVDPSFYKDHFGVEGRHVLLTFGFLSPGKGVEYVIKALPELVDKYPELVYVVLGTTHPNVKKLRGEEYRHSLHQLAGDLGVLDHVMFHDRFVDLEELCEFLGAADLYITPYLGEQQICSGTLSYALGAGKAVISTGYSYANEMLADGRGCLVPFEDSQAIATQIDRLLANETARHAMRKRAYLYTRDAVWRQVALSYLELFQEVVQDPTSHVFSSHTPSTESTSTLYAVPELKLDHLRTLTDDVGILQHARYTVPDRGFGYTTDDNARALVLSMQSYRLSGSAESSEMTVLYLSFLQHAYNPRTRRFRNFMSYDRVWSEESGSEESHACAIWGLGHTVALAQNEGIRATAVDLFEQALKTATDFTSPRAWALTLVGIHAHLRRYGGDSDARRVRESLALRLMALFEERATNDWVWPEETLTYAMGKLPHALIMAGQWLQRGDITQMGLRSLDWLLNIQVGEGGTFSPVGNQGWYPRGGLKARYDQQPLEAYAMLEACLEAYNVTREEHWLTSARRCFNWFLGKNDLGIALYDYATGGCRDGLQCEGINENQGAESTLVWLLSLLAIRSLEPASQDTKPALSVEAVV